MNWMKMLDAIKPAGLVYAHCDIPCGIYDPHTAQMAAQTVLRMSKLIQEKKSDAHAVARFAAVKEEHAEICKHEVRVIWGDYFKPENLQKFPLLHDTVWKIMKAASKARQESDVTSAEQLVDAVNAFAEIFWASKNVKTCKAKPYPTEKEIVLPVF
ncbi:MAG: superoxide dismutase, Ni [Candidatus Aenigmarchaeota archaeon]|nr:superoxide dismutase, Ni [Candidatus Aenigmarchaeota archaeon]